MIELYDKTGSVKLGDLVDCLDCLVEEERNGLFELSLSYPISSELCLQLKEENIIIANANDTLLNQKFRIYLTRKAMNGIVEVYARHISFDLAYDIVDSVNIENQSCEYALNTLFRQSQFSTNYKGYSDIVNAQDYKISMCNMLEAIGGKEGSIIDTFGTGAEILRDNTNIHVLNKRGHDNSVTIEYRKNLTGFELEEDTTELVTRILPYAKYTDNESNEEVLVKASFVDSPLITNYSHPYIRYIDYSDKFENENIPTIEKLKILAENEYKNNKVDIPKQNYKIEFIPLSKCVGYEGIEDKISLCDVVTIKDTRYDIETQSKVIKTVFDVLANRYESMELGEPRTTLGDIIGSGGNGEDGKPGPPGPPGQDGSVGDFPNTLPTVPVVTAKVYGFSTIELSWTFENKPYYTYELYASKTKDFTPNTFDLIHEGQTSSFLFQAKPSEIWYFKACGVNSHGNRTAFSNQVIAITKKVDDLSNYVDNMAINEALIGELSLDRGWVGKLNANYLDVKGNFSVTDGNGKRTMDIDSFGNVALDVTSLKISAKDVAIKEDLKNNVKAVDVMYYLSTSKTELIGGSWQTIAPVWTKDKYMWSKTVTTLFSGTIKESSPTCIAGASGENGTDGKGVASIQEQYYLSTSRTQLLGGSWVNNPPNAQDNKFLWTRSLITYTDNSYIYTNPISITGDKGQQGEKGQQGDKGQQGENGISISNIDVEYAISTSSTTAPTTGWQTTSPTWENGKYMWSRTKTVLSNGTTSYSKAACITGQKGANGSTGATGATGTGIQSITEEYYLSTSKTSQTGGSWVTSPPQWVNGKYMWTRSKIVYKNPTSTVYTTPVCDSSWDAANDALEKSKIYTNAEIKVVNDAIKEKVSSTEYDANNKVVSEKITEITKTTEGVKQEVSKKVGKTEVISSINQSAEAIKILAKLLELNGATSFVSGNTDTYARIIDACYSIVTANVRSMYMGGWKDANNKFVPVFYMGKNGFNSESSNVDGTYFSMTHDGKLQTLGARNKFTGNWSSVVWDPENQQINFYPESKCYTNKPFHFGNGVHLLDANGVIRAAITSNGVFADRITSYSGDTIWLGKNVAFENGSHMFTCNKIKGDTLLCDSDLKVSLSSYRALIPNDAAINTAYLGTSSRRWNRSYKTQADDISSDERLKEDIEYIDNNSDLMVASDDNITLDDMYDYIKNDLKLAKYKYKTSNEHTIGFIAQDIEKTKVGDILINENKDGMLSYDMGTRIAVLEGALQKAIEKIEILENMLNQKELVIEKI